MPGFDAHKNLAVSTIATAPSPATSGVTASVAAGTGTRFPAVPFYATISPSATLPDLSNSEIVRVTAMSGDNITNMTRAVGGTAARTVLVGDVITAGFTAEMLQFVENGVTTFDVRQYGAKCDDTTDDGPAVRAAVAACAAAGGGTVVVSGRCLITSTVTGNGSTQVGVSLPSQVALVGLGRENSWLRKGFAGGVLVDHSGTATGFATHVNKSSMRDITLTGGGTATGSLLRAYYADNFFVHNTRFIQHTGIGIDAVELWDSYFVSCTFENFTGNDGASPCVWLRNASAAAGFGSGTDNSNMVWFANCRFEAFVDGGLWVGKGDASNTNNPNGIFLTHAKFESHTVAGGTLPKGRFLYFDDACMLVAVDKADFFVGAFNAGSTTAVRALVCNAVASVSIQNIRFICTEAVGTMDAGIDFFCATGPAIISNIEHRGNAPVTALIVWSGGAGYANTIVQNIVVAAGTKQTGTPPGDLPESTLGTLPPTPAFAETLFSERQANRSMLAWRGSDGQPAAAQPQIARKHVGIWQAPETGTTVPGVFGMAALTAIGTATSRTPATTSKATRANRIGYPSAATAGTFAGARQATAYYSAGSGSLDGSGFYLVERWVESDPAAVTGRRAFIGVSSSVAAQTNVEPSTLTNVIGIGQISTDATQWQWISGGSAAQAAVAVGTGVGAPAGNSTTMWELIIHAPPTQANTFYCQLTNLTTGATASRTFTGAATVVPQSTTLLAWRHWVTNNATALAVGMDLCSLYIERHA